VTAHKRKKTTETRKKEREAFEITLAQKKETASISIHLQISMQKPPLLINTWCDNLIPGRGCERNICLYVH
jgi:hypothetical protein